MSLRPLRLAIVLAACTARPVDPGESASATDTTSGASTTSTAATATSSGPTSEPTTGDPGATDPGLTTEALTTSSGTSSSGTSSPFIMPPDGGTVHEGCDVWNESCPEGQKCMPFSGDGDNAWESLKCVDIVPNPAGLGEPCTYGPISTGEDTCAKHHICWNIDPDTGEGTCIAMCIGSPDSPACLDPAESCAINGEGVLNLCFPQCDPIAQDCENDDLCIPNPGEPERWLCVLDASRDEGQLFDPCQYANACDPGFLCALPELAVECDPMADGCCLPVCDTDDPNTCPGVGQECVPWYEDPADAAPFNADVGLCSLPMP